MDYNELNNRFKFHPATTQSRGAEHDTVRTQTGNLARVLNDVLPEGREKALAITHLEEVMMWANATIARQS